MKSPKKNENLVLTYIEGRGRVGLKELGEQFVPQQMAKGALYRTLERLVGIGKIVRIEIPKGERIRVYYEIPLIDTIAKTRRVIEIYKKENNDANPPLEEIAIEVGLPPDEVAKAVYAVAKDVHWSPSGNPKKLHGMFEQKLNKKETKFVLTKLQDANLQEVASNHLHFMSSKQELIHYPNFLTAIKKILETEPDAQTVENILNVLYYVFISPSFKEKNSGKIVREVNAILDWIYEMIKNLKYTPNIRNYAVRILGMLKDKRAIEILFNSLKNAQGNEYDYKNTFETWIFTEFYSKHKTELIERMFEIAVINKNGAIILSRLINQTLHW